MSFITIFSQLGQQQRMSFERGDAASRFVARTLRRRASAKARLGCSYEPA
jgi:hypothetical protein